MNRDQTYLCNSVGNKGNAVGFLSPSSNLVEGDTNGAFILDVFIHDRETGITERVSLLSTGIQANTTTIDCSLSSDGRFITFSTAASSLVENDTNNNILDPYVGYDVFIHDRESGITERVSVSSSGEQASLVFNGDEMVRSV